MFSVYYSDLLQSLLSSRTGLSLKRREKSEKILHGKAIKMTTCQKVEMTHKGIMIMTIKKKSVHV